MQPDGLIVFLGTCDLERTHAFYAGQLGLRLWRDQGLCRIYEVAPGAYVGFCRHQPVTPPEAGPIITILADDVDEAYRRLSGAGVPTTGPPRENPRFGIYHFFARDPEGYQIEVQRFLD